MTFNAKTSDVQNMNARRYAQEDKFFLEHWHEYCNVHEKFGIDESASSHYQPKHLCTGSDDDLNFIDELMYPPKHMREGTDQPDMYGEARYLIPHSSKQASHFSTGKQHRTSKDRRYIPFPDEKSGWNRVRSSGGKGAQHRKTERLLNQ